MEKTVEAEMEPNNLQDFSSTMSDSDLDEESSSSLEIVNIDEELCQELEEAAQELQEAGQDASGDGAAGGDGAAVPVPGGVVVGQPMAPIPDALSLSQYAQVIFTDVKDTYQSNQNIVCKYTLTPGFVASSADRIGIYRLPFLHPHEYLRFEWLTTTEQGASEVEVVFKCEAISLEADFYQFQYVKYDGSVAGASIPWQLHSQEATVSGDPSARGSEDRENLVLVQTPFSSLREVNQVLTSKVKSLEGRYNSLLTTSEQLNEELTAKSASYVVLDNQFRSLCVEKTQLEEMKADLETLVAEKLALEEKLHKTLENLGNSESSLGEARAGVLTCQGKLALLERSLEEKNREVSRYEAQLRAQEDARLAMEAKLLRLEEELLLVREERLCQEEERRKLGQMLEKELSQGEGRMAEIQRLVSKLEDSGSMLQAAQNSKELAVQEIRGLVEIQDGLNRDLKAAREDVERLIKEKEELELRSVQDPAVMEVLTSLGAKLEEAERKLQQQEVASQLSAAGGAAGQALLAVEGAASQQLSAVEGAACQQLSAVGRADGEQLSAVNGAANQQLSAVEGAAGEEVVEPTADSLNEKLSYVEVALQDADDRVDALTKENLQLKGELRSCEAGRQALQKENSELKIRLKMGADHYLELQKKHKSAISSSSSSTSCNCSNYIQTIKELNQEVRELKGEMRDSMEETRQGFADIMEAVSVSASEVNSMASINTMYSGDSNMESIRIRRALETGARPRHPAMNTNTMYHEGPVLGEDTAQSHTNPGREEGNWSPTSPTLPAPLEPENLDPSNRGIPELFPRQPARYSLTNTTTVEQQQQQDEEEEEEEEVYREVGENPQAAAEVECPICPIKFRSEDDGEMKLTQHMEQYHMDRECPFCYRLFPNSETKALQDHVQSHLRTEENGGLYEWDLGID